jgi:hypothetical protein
MFFVDCANPIWWLFAPREREMADLFFSRMRGSWSLCFYGCRLFVQRLSNSLFQKFRMLLLQYNIVKVFECPEIICFICRYFILYPSILILSVYFSIFFFHISHLDQLGPISLQLSLDVVNMLFFIIFLKIMDHLLFSHCLAERQFNKWAKWSFECDKQPIKKMAYH